MSGQIHIFIKQGDITEMKVDAVVNAANTNLLLGAGVAGAIRRKGGPTVGEECERHGPVKLGGAAMTGGGELKAPYVIHAASMHLGRETTSESLRESVRNTLRIAEEEKLKSLAFPAIGTGVAGFPMDCCAEIMLDEVLKHGRGTRSLEEIHFVLFDAQGFNIFQKKYAALSAAKTSTT